MNNETIPLSILVLLALLLLVVSAIFTILHFVKKMPRTRINETMGSPGPSSANAKFYITLSSDPIVITDESNHILNFNEAFRSLVESEIILTNQSIADLLRFTNPAGSEVTVQSLTNFKNADSLQHESLFLLTKANHKVEVQASIFRIRDQNGSQIVWRIINTTTLKHLEQQQSDFLSVISHELRTPVTVIEASTASLLTEQESFTATQKKLLSATRENTLLLSKLLADLSIYNVLQANPIEPTLSSVSPRMILDQMQKVFTSQAETKNIVLVVDHDQNTRNIISGESHILSILQNFISNAINYSEPGAVVILATKAVADGVVFFVRDTGVGMDATTQANIFQNTFHANTDTKHRTLQGAGIGLYISAKLANAIGASVWAESQVQKGSTFYLKVPVSYETAENKQTVHGLELVKFAQDV